MRNKLDAMVAIVMLIVPTVGHATLISHTLDITASNFVLIFGGSLPPPVSPLMIDFTVTLDNAGDISPTTTGLTVHSFNLPDAVQFTYNHSSDLLILASVPFASLANQTTSSGGVWSAQAISTRVVAEPGTLELVLSIALAAFGFSQRAQHKRRRTARRISSSTRWYSSGCALRCASVRSRSRMNASACLTSDWLYHAMALATSTAAAGL